MKTLMALPVFGILIGASLLGSAGAWASASESSLQWGAAVELLNLASRTIHDGKLPQPGLPDERKFAADGVGHGAVFEGDGLKVVLRADEGTVPTPGEIRPSISTGKGY